MTTTPPTVGTFNPLTVPTIEKYEKYIPTAFNSELTMLQKVNNLLNYMSTVTDVVNTFGDQWNQVVDWVDGDGLNQDVINQLTAWLNDGTLDGLINSTYSNATHTLYVNGSTGTDLNDGQTSGTPFKTIQKAVDTIQENCKPVLWGTWIVSVAAGTYSESVIVPNYLISQNPIQFIGAAVGGHPNIPTTIISMGEGSSAVGLQAFYGANIYVQDIKFSGFNGTASSGGIVVAYKSSLVTNNVHTENCYWGVSGEHQSAITLPDGLHNNCGFLTGQTTGNGAAIRSLQQTNHYIGNQNASNQLSGFQITNSATGFYAQELSTGHVNWGTISGCGDGIRVIVMSRANIDGVKFSGNTRDVRIDTNSHVYVPSSTVFDGSSQETIVQESGGLITGTPLIAEYDESYSIDFKTYALNVLNQTVTNNSALAVHTSTLKAPHWATMHNSIVPGRIIRFRVTGVLNGTLNNKRINCRLNDGTHSTLIGLTFGPTDTGPFETQGEVIFTGNGTQTMVMKGCRHLQQSTLISRMLGTVPMTIDTTLTIEASIDDTTQADSILIDTVEMSISG